MDALQPLYRVAAPDLIGYGGSPVWPPDTPFDLDDELRALQDVLPCCAKKYHLVGYSYGGVVALHLAIANPSRILSLTLIEPVFFSALLYSSQTAAYNELCRIRDNFVAALARGQRELAMQDFIDFWSGTGSWMAMPEAMRNAMLAMADKIVLDWRASFAANPGRNSLLLLGDRTALVRGEKSPRPMRCLVDALHALMPGSVRKIVEGATHLLPLTHSSPVIEAITEQLAISFERRMR